MSLHEDIHSRLLRNLQAQSPSAENLNGAFRLMAKYRCKLIENTLVHKYGTKVMAGPFAGMDFVESSAEGCHIPKLLGCYEEELHGFLTQLPQSGYRTVLNIGCAEGYYAVGIKRLLPDATIVACDINEKARAACQSLASRNGVAIDIRGEFMAEDFAAYSGRVLVWCDIEGAERQLLDPAKVPRLKDFDLVVELHPSPDWDAERDFLARFGASHDIEVLHAGSHHPELPPFLRELGHLDQLLAQWEWRSSPTPWLIMRSKNR
jgi:SAM-dependent methyltransferase